MTRDSRVRVLHLISDAGPHPYFSLIGDHTDRRRFDVRIATLGPRGALNRDAESMDLPTFSLHAGGRHAYPQALLALTRRLRRDRIEVLQTHLLDASVVGLTAGRIARTPATIFTGHHSHEIPLQNRKSLTAIDRLCAGPLSDAIIAPSAQMRDGLVHVHRVRADKVAVIHHGFELDHLDLPATSGDEVRRELGLEGRVVMTAIGRFYWIKNQPALVRAFAAVAPEVPDAMLVLVGAGDSAPVRSLARSLRLDDRVRVLPARRDVPALLAATDLFVHPALAESFAMVIIEAMAMRCPVVSTPVGIAPDVVVTGETGVLATDSNEVALARALRAALSMRDRWPALGQAARERSRPFSAAAMVAAYERLYTALVGGATDRS